MPKLRETIVAIELDGVLFKPQPGKSSTFTIGAVVENVADMLRRLHKDGFSIVAWSCRTSRELNGADVGELRRRVMDLLQAAGLSFVSVTLEGKPCAACYIDSRAIMFQEGDDVLGLEETIRALAGCKSDVPTSKEFHESLEVANTNKAAADEIKADEAAKLAKDEADAKAAEEELLRKTTPASAADRLAPKQHAPLTDQENADVTQNVKNDTSTATPGVGGRPGESADSGVIHSASGTGIAGAGGVGGAVRQENGGVGGGKGSQQGGSRSSGNRR